MVVLLADSPISAEDFQHSVTSLTKSLFARLLSLAGQQTLDTVVPNFFSYTIIEPTVLLGTLKALEIVVYPRHYLCQNFMAEVYRKFLGLHDLVFVLTCSVNSGTLYAQVCVQSIKFATPIKFLTHLKDNWSKQDTHSKGTEYLLCK